MENEKLTGAGNSNELPQFSKEAGDRSEMTSGQVRVHEDMGKDFKNNSVSERAYPMADTPKDETGRRDAQGDHP